MLKKQHIWKLINNDSMKKFYHILSIVVAALLMTGCYDNDLSEKWQEMATIDSNMVPVSLGFQITEGADFATTRSLVGGEESNASLAALTMKLLCFDQGGLFLGVFDAKITPTEGTTSTDGLDLTPIKGKIEAMVPSTTARVHFIANPPEGMLSDPSKSYTGWLENRLMENVDMTSDYLIDQDISYWGYHREADYEAMSTYLTSDATVKLLRDRVKLTMDMSHANKDPETQQDLPNEGIASISWTIHNGLKKGSLAPFNTENFSDPFSGYETNAPLTPFTAGGRYSVVEENLQSSSTPQYLFEDTMDKEVSIILKVTFKDNTVKYHRVLLMKDKSNVQELLRDHHYILNIGYLPKSTGSDTFTAALTAPPSNNQAAAVSPLVPDVSDGDYTLKINGNTTLIYDTKNYSADVQTAEFEFTTSNSTDSPLPTSKDAFTLTTSTSSGLDNAVVTSGTDAPKISSYDSTTGKGTIQFKVNNPGNTIAYTKIEIQEKETGLSRSLEVYAISKFSLSNVALTHDGNTRLTVTKNVVTVTGSGNNKRTVVTPTQTQVTYDVYKLTFDLPASLPEGMFPLDIKFATSTLNAYSDKDATTEVHTFGVESGDTSMLTESTSQTDWNYGAKNWNAWFVYTIPEKPTSNTVTFYFNDVRSSRAVEPNSVGLYLKIEHFGDIMDYSLSD